MSHRRLFCLVSTLWFFFPATACHQDNSWYCADRAYNNCVNNPGEFPCSDKSDCTAQDGKLACSEPNEETGTGICVQCTASDTAACLGVTPICGVDHACRGCGKHSDCSSAVCLADGSCGSEVSAAYVAPSGAGATCTKTAPCGTLGAALATGKATIKIASGLVKSNQTTVIDGKSVTIVADEGAKLDRDGDGAIMEVRSAGADVKIYDLEVTGATGASGGNGIDVTPNGGVPKLTLVRVKLTGNQGLGISAQGGSISVSRSTINGNVGGGISISNATFDITNNFIYRNGDQDTTTFGGLNLGVASATGNRLEFNTIVDNRAAVNSGGVICNVPTFAGANNIIARNSLAGSTTATGAQTSGACTYPTSLVQNDVTGLSFERPDPPAPFSYKLTAGSSAINAASTASMIVVDIDGDARPQGAQKDVGADEYVAK